LPAVSATAMTIFVFTPGMGGLLVTSGGSQLAFVGLSHELADRFRRPA
jgi:hypothetical protein